ncbi:30S ribosomal protein S20 [Pseudoalteromonas espejiana]
MANIKSAKNALSLAKKPSAQRKPSFNDAYLLQKVTAAIEAGDKEAAQQAFSVATPILDRYATKGLIHKNKAARHKSRLAAKIKAL